MRPVRGLTAVLAAAALVAPGCDDSEERTRAHEPTPADLVPRDAYLYAEATLRLSGPTGGPAQRFVRNLTGLSTIDDEALMGAVGRALGDPGFERDIDPWFRERAGLFVVGTEDDEAGVGLILDVAKPDTLPTFFRTHLGPGARRAEYRGVAYRRGTDNRAAGRIGKRVLLASSNDVMRAAIDARRRPFSRTARYRRARGDGPLPFAFGVGDIADVSDGLGRVVPLDREERTALDVLFPSEGEARFTVGVSPREAKASVSGIEPPEEPAPPIGDLPGDTWLAISSGNLALYLAGSLGQAAAPSGTFGRALSRMVEAPVPEAMLRELRAGTFFIQGGAETPSGELVAEVADPRVVGREVFRLGRTVERTGRYHVALSPDRSLPQFEATGARERIQEFSAELRESTLTFEFGFIGSADELSDRPGYRHARRALGKPPTLLLDMRTLAESESEGEEAPLSGRVSLVAGAESSHKDGLELSLLLRISDDAAPPSRDGTQ